MEDKLTACLILLSIIPLTAVAVGVCRELLRLRGERRQVAVARAERQQKQTEYDDVVAAVHELETDFFSWQNNTSVNE